MSRALDKGVKEALKHGNHEEIFNAIAGVLSSRRNELLEIEFLGMSHLLEDGIYFLRDGPAIAIPKLRLVQAFIFAQSILKKNNGAHQTKRKLLLDATAVMLVMDPEHLTAANTRKRLLVETHTEDNVENEKYFIDSLLTSRLHRHTKSPTLWNHREWLLRWSTENNITNDADRDFTKVILVAAERHPRNYYAWSHARFLRKSKLIDDPSKDTRRDIKWIQYTKKWCFSHHDDISGWTFLTVLLKDNTAEKQAIFDETLNLALSFHWRGESVWYFLRNLALTLSQEHQERLENARASLCQCLEAGTLDELVLERVASWMQRHSREVAT